LWSTPNCYITPHTAGGFREEMQQLVSHFLKNLDRFANQQELRNRVI
jgi:phosphoglycerate dehydrogenase-like enzyme